MIFGFSTYFGGLRIWTTKGSLLGLSVIPFILDLVCLTAGVYFAVSRTPALVSHFTANPLWYYPLLLITGAGLLLAAAFISLLFANLIVFPFNDRLAEKTLALKQALPEKRKGLRSWFSASLKNASSMFKKTMLLLVAGIVMIVLAWIPGLGFVVAAASAVLMAIDRMDYAFDHYQWSFRERLTFTARHFPEVLGFAAGLGLTAMIPVFNVIFLPGSVVAGASLVAELAKKHVRTRSPQTVQ